MAVEAFLVGVTGTDWTRIVNARSRGQAKAAYYRDVHEAWESVRYTDITCKRLGPAVTSEDFARVATKRGLPNARCGMQCLVGERLGTIVGHNSSANFDVLLPDGLVYNVHPASLSLLAQSPDKEP